MPQIVLSYRKNRDATARSPVPHTCSDLALKRGVSHTHSWNECVKCDILQNQTLFVSLARHMMTLRSLHLLLNFVLRTHFHKLWFWCLRFIHVKPYDGSQRVGELMTTLLSVH